MSNWPIRVTLAWIISCLFLFMGCGGSGSGDGNGEIDTSSPSTPQNVTGQALTYMSISLSWNASTDNVGVAGYAVYRDDEWLADSTSTTFTDTGLTELTEYCYVVDAFDAAENDSEQSQEVCITTLADTGDPDPDPDPTDTTAPSVPAGLAANVVSSQVISLSWTASTDAVGVTGYNVYRDGTQLTTVSTTSHSDTGLVAATNYCYTVSALDLATNESAQSDQVCATTSTGTVTNAFYVAPTGDDSNPGTEASPWKTIQKASSTLTAGQTVYIRSGTYNEQVTPQNSGTAGQVITYTNYPGEAPVLDGTGVTLGTFEGLFYIAGTDTNNTVDYITVDGLKVQNVGGQFLGVTPPDPEADEFPNYNFSGIMVEFGSNITIKNNKTYNTISSGISAWNSSNIVIDGNDVELACNDGEQECITVATTNTFEITDNTIHDSGAGTIGGEGIDAKDGSKNGTISGNIVYNINRLGIYLDAWNKDTQNIKIFNNLIHDNKGDGLTVASEDGGLLHDIYFYNNVVYNNQNNGVTIAGYGNDVASHPIQDVYIYNNTFYNNGIDWGGCVSVENSDLSNIVIRNNICSQNQSFQIASEVSTTPLVVDHNLCDGQKEDSEPSTEFQGTAVVSGSPLFVNVTSGSEDLQLQAASPAIDVGNATSAPSDDYSGTTRPVGSGIDIGAYEYSP